MTRSVYQPTQWTVLTGGQSIIHNILGLDHPSIVSECTCQGVLDHRVVQTLTHPLLAALARQQEQPRVGAVWHGQPGIHGARRHAGHPPALAAAVGVAGRLEGLAVAVGDPVEFTAQILLA